MSAEPRMLAAQIRADADGVQDTLDRLRSVAARLVSTDPLVAGHAYDHAEEHLGWVSSELTAHARKVDSLLAYTVTGEGRAPSEERVTRWVTPHDSDDVGWVVNTLDDMALNYRDMKRDGIAPFPFDAYLGSWTLITIPRTIAEATNPRHLREYLDAWVR